MKAKLIIEAINFNREGSDMDKFDVGIGPAKYIELFEKTLKLLNIEYDKKENEEGVITWDLDNIFDTDYVMFIPKSAMKRPGINGWHLFLEGYEKDPFNIIDILIERKYGNINEKIQLASEKIKNAKKEYDYLVEIEERIKEVNNIAKNNF